MENNLDDFIKKKSIQIIEWKNILLIIAIIIFLAAIYFNKRAIAKLLGKESSIDDKTAHSMELSLDVAALIVILISLYVSYEEYLLDKTKDKDLTESIVIMIAWTIAIIPAAIFLYIAMEFPDHDGSTGIEPIV